MKATNKTLKWQRAWSGLEGTPDAWKLEIDIDRMRFDRPVVVTVYIENPGETGDVTRGGECGLAELSPTEARDLAGALLQEADNAEQNNRRNGEAA